MFKENLSEIKWYFIDYNDGDVAWSNLKKLFMSVVDKIAALKEITFKTKI